MAKQDVGQLVYDVSMDVQQLMEARQKIDAQMYGLSKSADKAGQGIDRLEKKTDSLGGGFTQLASAVKAYITVQAALKLVEVAQEFELLATRVQMASKSAADGERNFRALMAISAENGSDLKETVSLFSQMSATLRSIGATSGDVQQLVNTLQKIGTVGGSSQEEMNNALRQFMQSMASGRVQAEEFNSIIEQMPELGRQIAAGMGIPFDQLRQLMLAGKLDIGSVLEAIYKQTDDVNEKFKEMPRTVAQASNALVNSFGRAIAQVDKQIGATKYFAKLLDGAALTVDIVTGNAGPDQLIDQKLQKNAENLKIAEDDLTQAKKAGYQWGIKNSQASVDRLKAERETYTLAKQTNKELNSAVSGQTTGGDRPDYIQNLAKKTATNSAQAIISAGQSDIEKLQSQRNQLKANYDKQLLDKDTFSKADAVLNQKIADAQAKENKKAAGGKKANPYAQGESSVASFQRQLGVLALRYDENSREAAQFNAVQAVGEHATETQKARISELAGALYDAKQKQADWNSAIQNDPTRKENKSYSDSALQLKRQYSEQIIDLQTYNQQSEKLEQEHQVNLAKIRADTAAGVTPLQDAQGAIDPVQALANENTRKLALIQQFETEKGVITANGLALMNAQNTEYEQARIDAAWKIWENQNQTNQLLGGAIDSLQGGATNAITGLINGTQSLQESLANIGTTILNSVVGGLVEMGLQYVKSMVMGQVAAAASLAATTTQASAAALAWAPAAMSASIATYGTAATVGSTAYAGALAMAQGMAVAGARKNGGPVSAGSMYQVGEGGMPEIYQASTGKQYMIPGDNGSVISNKDLAGSGAGGGVINQVNHFTFEGSTADTTQTQAAFAKIAYDQSLKAIKDQQRPGGMLQKSR